MIPFLESREEKRYKQYIRVFLRQYQMAHTCADCDGTKLRPEALYVRVDGLDDRARERSADRRARTAGCDMLSDEPERRCRRRSAAIAEPILRELRSASALPAGCRPRLPDAATGRRARCPAAKRSASRSRTRSARSLVDTLYVLDEPTIGLHPRDTDRLLALLKRLRDARQHRRVVEHDAAAIAVGRSRHRTRAGQR